MKYLLCEVESFYDEVFDGSLCRVTKPLQVFSTKEDAEEAMELMSQFYDYNLRVVPANMLGEEFR
ncbi:hypothetical protein CPT_Shemara_072 [Salmonella phage Shemara]|uniref:Uncharacterized protein n=1 Tax=Salmonella phage Shemara TaxID=2596714 RepID=A0A5B8RN33_9CAUD|nr:hypothetical protein PF624_gp72 [Salmonella phage Shemara]QEA10401.1 hypothetical protein CPT_Shemara_072 [Salmonella phage Shemara]